MTKAKTVTNDNPYIATAPAEMLAVKASELLKTDKAIMASLKGIGADGVSLQRRVHIAACSVLRRLGEHSDIRIVHAFMAVLPASYRTNALRDWFSAYGPVSWDKNKAVFVKDTPIQLTKALNEPFWTFSPEAAYVPLDVAKMLDAAVKKLTKDQTETGKNHGPTIAALEAAKAAGLSIGATAH